MSKQEESYQCTRLHDNSGTRCPDCGALQHNSITDRTPLYSAVVDPTWEAQRRPLRLTDAEMRLILRLRQAAGQGRLVVVDPDAMAWYLCGPQERSR